MDADDTPFPAGKSRATWFFSLLGGVKRRGKWQMPRDMRVLGTIGGADLDLCEADVPERAALTKISVVGGVSLLVPHDVTVEVEGFRIFGGVRVAPSSAQGSTKTIKVREFGLIGGVRVERCESREAA